MSYLAHLKNKKTENLASIPPSLLAYKPSNTSQQSNLFVLFQVLSESVANALELKGDEELSSTITLIRNVNKAFDCLNVRSLDQGARTRNENLKAYTSADDPRLEVI